MTASAPVADLRWPERLAAGLVLATAWVPAARLGRTGLLTAAALALGVVAVAAARVARRLTGSGANALDRAVVATVVGAAGLVVPATGLGHFGALWRGPFWSVVALLAVAASFLRERQSAVEAQATNGGNGWTARLVAALATAAVAWLAVGLALSVGEAGARPPGVIAYDDLSYHLPAAATWWQTGDLRMLKFAMGDPATAFYPIAGELLSWALLALLSGSDFLARFTELPFAFALLVALAALARRLGLDWPLTGLAVALAGTLPRLFPHLMLSAGNDVASAFYAVALAHAALLLAERPDRGRALAAGLALGLLVGAKYAGVLLLPAVGLPLAVALASRGRTERRAVAGALAAILAAAAAAGGYAYLRNLATTGNPLFPAGLTLFGRELLPGWPQVSAAAWKARPEYPIDAWRFLSDNAGQLGPLFPWVLLPAALAPLVALARRRATDRWLAAALLALPVTSWTLFLTVFYDHRDVRYVLAGLAATALCAAWLVGLLPGGAGTLARGGLALAALVGLALRFPLAPEAWPWVAVPAVGVLSGGWGAILRTAFWQRLRPRLHGPSLALGGAVLLALGAVDPAAHFERRRLDRDGAAVTVEALTRQRATTIAYVGWNQPYLFFGHGLRHRVRLLPTHAAPGAEHYVWGGSLAMPRERADRAAWLANLEAARVELVVVVREGEENPERAWIAELPERFTQMWSDGRTEIWRVERGPNPP